MLYHASLMLSVCFLNVSMHTTVKFCIESRIATPLTAVGINFQYSQEARPWVCRLVLGTQRLTLIFLSSRRRLNLSLTAISIVPTASMSKIMLSSGDELSDLRIRVKRLEREKDSLQESLRLEKRDHEATKADWNEDLLIAQKTIDALNAKLKEALSEARLEREERGRVEQRLRAEMFDRSEVSAVSTPEVSFLIDTL
ncbi:hypothetical protein PENSPDRAFT_264156 [Peniophora sp. CONT]|nr:hypothetical protein PENSPDRAFT_264156 [Peniophora sp. CONT]